MCFIQFCNTYVLSLFLLFQHFFLKIFEQKTFFPIAAVEDRAFACCCNKII